MTVTDQDLRAITHLVGRCRGDWEAPGIYAALDKVRDEHSLAGLTVRAMRATERRDQRSPAIIAMPGTHCRLPDEPPPTPQPPRLIRGEMSPTDPAPPESAARHLADLRQTVRSTTRPEPKEG